MRIASRTEHQFQRDFKIQDDVLSQLDVTLSSALDLAEVRDSLMFSLTMSCQIDLLACSWHCCCSTQCKETILDVRVEEHRLDRHDLGPNAAARRIIGSSWLVWNILFRRHMVSDTVYLVHENSARRDAKRNEDMRFGQIPPVEHVEEQLHHKGRNAGLMMRREIPPSISTICIDVFISHLSNVAVQK